MPFQIIRNDITKVKADAIVNTANPQPCYGSGTDSAIYHAAGEEQLLAERRKIGEIKPGNVAVTPAFALSAKYIIHTVGPAWIDGANGEFDILKSCYKNCLEEAKELGCNSIAFPLISAGSYGFPKDKALSIALSEIQAFLMREDVDMDVRLVVFDKKAFRLSSNLFSQVETFIEEDEVLAQHMEEYGGDDDYPILSRSEQFLGRLRNRRRGNMPPDERLRDHRPGNMPPTQGKTKEPKAVETDSATCTKPFDEYTFDKAAYMNDGKEELPFQKHFFALILEKGLDNATVYKRANVNRKAFSKIQNGDTKIPKKETVLAFCIGMELNLEEAEALLASAGMAFNPYDKRDRLIVQCILHEQYNIYEVNIMLFDCNLPQLS